MDSRGFILAVLVLHSALASGNISRALSNDYIPYGGYSAGLRRTMSSPSLCGAILIHPRVLITSASCVSTHQVQWAAISPQYLGDSERIKIEKIHMHPASRALFPSHVDVAIVELVYGSTRPLATLSYDYDANNIRIGTPVYLRGLSAIDVSGATSSQITTDGRIQPSKLCIDTFRYGFHNSMICATGSGSKSCQADIGSPVTVLQNDKEVVFGMITLVNSCGYGPTMYTSLGSARDFIEPFKNLPLLTDEPIEFPLPSRIGKHE